MSAPRPETVTYVRLATSSKSLENQFKCHADHVEHEYDLYFDLRLDLQCQIRGQMTGNGLEEKVSDRFAIFFLQDEPIKMASRSQKTRFVKVILQG